MAIYEMLSILVCFLAVIVVCILGFYFLSPLITDNETQLEKGDKIAQKILNNTNVSCNEIIQLRLEHEKGKIVFYESTQSELRDIYNIKSCGTHWGWFEP